MRPLSPSPRSPSPRPRGQAGLSARAAGVLSALIRAYLRSGEPVGSAVIAASPGLEVSAATVRVVLAELTEAGLLEQPHTSAGRVPSPEGLRLYVEHLMRQQSPSARARQGLSEALRQAGIEPDALVRAASRHLSAATAETAVARRPRVESSPVRRLELMPLAPGRALAALLFEDGVVRHQLVAPLASGGLPDVEALARAQRLFNARWAGRTLDAIRAGLRAELAAANRDDASLLEVAAAALPPPESADDALIVEGWANLLGRGVDPDHLSQAAAALEDKQRLLELIEGLIPADGTRVVIGAETGIAMLSAFTLVTAAYGIDERRLGAIAIIAPVRMNYARIVPWVGCTADTLSCMLHAAAA